MQRCKNCTYSNGKLNIINFLAKINKSNDSIEFKVGTNKYFAINQFDKNKICDFILHLELLGEELLLKYKQITKYLNVILSSTSLTSYALISPNNVSMYSSILIKNGKIIFEYKETSKYTYSSISKLLNFGRIWLGCVLHASIDEQFPRYVKPLRDWLPRFGLYFFRFPENQE